MVLAECHRETSAASLLLLLVLYHGRCLNLVKERALPWMWESCFWHSIGEKQLCAGWELSKCQ